MKKLFIIYNEETQQATTSPYTSKSRLLEENRLQKGEKIDTITEQDKAFDQLWEYRNSLRFYPQSLALLKLISRHNPSKELEDTAEALYLKFVDAGIILDSVGNIGKNVASLVAKKSVFDICRAVEEFFGVESLRAEDYDTIMELTISY